jgi:hypothetical protein
VVQQISIDPELWARARRKAFDIRSTATKIVEAALTEYLDRLDEKPPAGPATKPLPVPNRPEPIRAGNSGDPRGLAPWDMSPAAEPLSPPADETTTIGAAAEIVEIIPLPKNATPKDVEQAVKQFATRPFSPVPKPTATKKAARR